MSEASALIPPTWEEQARRTRSVAAQWRAVALSEEAKCAEMRATCERAIADFRKAEEERDIAVRRAEVATKAATAAKAESAQWHARSTAQTTSKTFVELHSARTALEDRESVVSSLHRALQNTRRELDDCRAAKQRELNDREALANDRITGLRADYASLQSENATMEATIDELRTELSHHLAECPPHALHAARDTIARHERTIKQLETSLHTLRAEVARWRDRARGAVANERLTQLRSDLPNTMVPPPATRPASHNGVGRDGRGREDDPANDPALLRGEIEFCREETEVERERQRGFLETLWASDSFSQLQKHRLTAWLRQPPSRELP
jgi:chromosome segregation ATPase